MWMDESTVVGPVYVVHSSYSFVLCLMRCMMHTLLVDYIFTDLPLVDDDSFNVCSYSNLSAVPYTISRRCDNTGELGADGSTWLATTGGEVKSAAEHVHNA